MRKLIPALVLVAMLLTGATPGWACMTCKSETGRRVREGIFDSQFGPNLLMTLSPFPLFLGLVAWIHFGFPGTRREPNPLAPSLQDDQPETPSWTRN